MARYIDLEILERRIKKYVKPEIPEEKAFVEWCKDECIRQAYAMPTADVVPKSEYDAVVSAVDNSTQEFLKLHDDYQEAKREVERLQKERDEYKKHVDNDIIYVHRIKAEVAREIFEEIDALFVRFYDDTSYSSGELGYDIAELKKKYTKENTENENQN